MSHSDIGLLIAVPGVIVLALISLAWWAIRQDYQLTGSVRLSKRNPPKPPRSPAGTVPPPAGSTEATP